jgi:hypothetical protein
MALTRCAALGDAEVLPLAISQHGHTRHRPGTASGPALRSAITTLRNNMSEDRQAKGAETEKMRENQHGSRLTHPFARGLLLAAAGVFALALAPAVATAAVAAPRPPKTIYAITFSGNSALYRLAPRSHAVTLEGHTRVELTDVTFRGKTLYAISFTYLYRLNPATGASHRIGSLGLSAANALVTQPKTNTLYGADLDGNFFKINNRTGHATIIGSFGHDLGSSGDLTFANGHLYATVSRSGSSASLLARINVRTGAAKVVGNTRYRNVWGLVTGTRALYGATRGGSFIAISPTTGRTRLIWKERIAVGGMAVRP